MTRYALDSNIISFVLKEHKIVRQNLKNANDRGWVVRIPPYAYYEVKRGFAAIKATGRLRKFAAFCKQYPVGALDDTVLEAAVEIYAGLKVRGWNIDEMDIFIAAWCRVNDFTLVTNNTRQRSCRAHFAQISGLALADWSV